MAIRISEVDASPSTAWTDLTAGLPTGPSYPSGTNYPFLVDVTSEGYYVLGTYLLTGEERTGYSQAIVPLRPFSPIHGCFGPGAWEVVARFAFRDMTALHVTRRDSGLRLSASTR